MAWFRLTTSPQRRGGLDWTIGTHGVRLAAARSPLRGWTPASGGPAIADAGPRRPSLTGRPGRGPGGLGADHGTIGPAAVRGTVVWQRLATQRGEFGLQPDHVTARQTLRLEKGYRPYGNDVHERWVGTRARRRGRHSGSEVVSNVTVSEGHTVGKLLAVADAEGFHAGPGIRLVLAVKGGRGWRRPQRPGSWTRRTCGSGPRRQDAVGTL
jgi:hypothetical protein